MNSNEGFLGASHDPFNFFTNVIHGNTLLLQPHSPGGKRGQSIHFIRLEELRVECRIAGFIGNREHPIQIKRGLVHEQAASIGQEAAKSRQHGEAMGIQISTLTEPTVPDLFTINRLFNWNKPHGQWMNQMLKDIETAKKAGDMETYNALTIRYMAWAEKYMRNNEPPQLDSLR